MERPLGIDSASDPTRRDGQGLMAFFRIPQAQGPQQCCSILCAGRCVRGCEQLAPGAAGFTRREPREAVFRALRGGSAPRWLVAVQLIDAPAGAFRVSPFATPSPPPPCPDGAGPPTRPAGAPSLDLRRSTACTAWTIAPPRPAVPTLVQPPLGARAFRGSPGGSLMGCAGQSVSHCARTPFAGNTFWCGHRSARLRVGRLPPFGFWAVAQLCAGLGASLRRWRGLRL